MIPLRGPKHESHLQLTPSSLCATLVCIFSSPKVCVWTKWKLLDNLINDASEILLTYVYLGKSILGTQGTHGRIISTWNTLTRTLKHAWYLPKRRRGHLEQTAPTISYTWVWRSILVFQICTNVLRDTSLLLL